VTCEETASAISLGPRNAAMKPETLAHIAACEHCWRLLWTIESGPDVGPPQSGRWERIQAAILRDLKPVRPLARPVVYVLTFAVIFLAVLAAALTTPGSASGWNALTMGQRVLVFSVLAGCGALLTISLVRQMSPGSRDPIPPAALLAGIPAALVLVIALMFRPQNESGFLANGAMCLRVGLSYSILAALALWIPLRRGAMLRPWLTGAAVGGFAGLVGLSVLEINCSNHNFNHILVWHGGVVVASSLSGAGLCGLFAYIDNRIYRTIV
jgi:hypothetical protein